MTPWSRHRLPVEDLKGLVDRAARRIPLPSKTVTFELLPPLSKSTSSAPKAYRPIRHEA